MKNQDPAHIDPQKQRGNVLIFLLIAIFLLGGLTALLVRTSSNTDITGEAERGKITASSVMSYASGLENAVQALLSRGCSETQISFRVGTEANYNNTSAPTSNQCHVFDVLGGAQTRRFFTDADAVSGTYSVEGIGTAATDLIFNNTVPRDVCEQINLMLGIANNGTEGPPTDAMGGGTRFVGAYGAVPANAQKLETAAFTGKRSGCRHNNGTGVSAVYIFYYVLHAR